MQNSAFGVSAIVAVPVGFGVAVGAALCSLFGTPLAIWAGIVLSSAGWLGILLQERAAAMTADIEGLWAALLAFVRRLGKMVDPVQVTIAEREPITAVRAPVAEPSAYTYTNGKGKTYYLHSRVGALNNHDAPIFFFRREVQDGALPAMPAGYYVHETPNGMPVLRRANHA